MFLIEPAEHAPRFLKAVIAHHAASRRTKDDFRAVVMAKRYVNADVEKHPALRDRTGEFKIMLSGFGDGSSVVASTRMEGHELAKFGFLPVGAQFATTYDILWIN